MSSSNTRIRLIAIAVGALLSCPAAYAQQQQQQNIPGHPRVNEVDHRLANQEKRIDQGVADGQISGKQAARDLRQDDNIAQREARDEAEHHGHLTKREDRNLNKSLNHDSRRIRRQRHK